MIFSPENTNQLRVITFLISLLALIPILLLYPKPEKYKAEILSEKYKVETKIETYNDLDFDGLSELIRFDLDFLNQSSIIVQKGNKFLYQHNFDKPFVNVYFFFFGDYNNDNQKEIYLFQHANDSIFLTVIESLSGNFILKEFYIDTYSKFNGRIDFSIQSQQLIGLDKVENKQLVFNIYCAFSKSIRHIYKINLDTKKLQKSEEGGLSIYKNIRAYDIDKDGEKELFGNFSMFGNYNPTYPYSDLFGWLMVYGHNLAFKFTPYKIGKYPGRISTAPLQNNKFAALYEHLGEGEDSSFIGIYNGKGILLNKRNVASSIENEALLFVTEPKDAPNQLKLIQKNGEVTIYDSQLDVIKHWETKPLNVIWGTLDINNDGINEYILPTPSENGLTIATPDFKNHVKLATGSFKYIYPSIYQINNKKPLLFICQDKTNYFIEYSKNVNYTLYWFYIAGFWLVVFGLLVLLGYYNQMIAKRKYENEKQIGELQLLSIKNQLAPHFTFNILNSIGGLYNERDAEKANLMIGRYAKLLRQAVFQSGKVDTTLKDELRYTENYILLEQFRYNKKFDYTIEIDKQVNQTFQLPKLLIHSFVENAIKHGLKHLKEKGDLKIQAHQNNSLAKIIITDNGIGREKAKEYSSMSTGKGLEIVNQTLELYFKLKNVKIEYKIDDLYSGKGEPNGTRVTITIPIG